MPLHRPSLAWRRRTCVLAAALALAPAWSRDLVVDSLDAGNLRLQQVQRLSGPQLSANVGLHRVTYFELELLDRGRPVALPQARGATRGSATAGWVLADAPRPAVLLATDQWLLVTLRDGRPHAQVLPRSRGERWQWADAGTAAGPAEQVRVRTERQALALQGGRRLLLDGQWVLDVQALHLQALSLEVPESYRPAPEALLGSSPDGRALALLFAGASNSARDALIVVAGTDRAERTLLPVDLKALTGVDTVTAAPDLLTRHFTWQTDSGDALPRLLPRPAARAAWAAHYRLGAQAARGAEPSRPSFTLSPVRPSMLPAAAAEVSMAVGLEPAPARPGDPDASNLLRLVAPRMKIPLVLRFDAPTRSLVAESEYPEGPLWAEQAVRRVGEHLEGRLEAGALREHLASPR